MMQKLKSLSGSTLIQHTTGLGLALLANSLEIQMLTKACSSSSRVKVWSKLERAQLKMQLSGSNLERRKRRNMQKFLTIAAGIALGVLSYELCDSLSPKLASCIAKCLMFAILWWVGLSWFSKK